MQEDRNNEIRQKTGHTDSFLFKLEWNNANTMAVLGHSVNFFLGGGDNEPAAYEERK